MASAVLPCCASSEPRLSTSDRAPRDGEVHDDGHEPRASQSGHHRRIRSCEDVGRFGAVAFAHSALRCRNRRGLAREHFQRPPSPAAVNSRTMARADGVARNHVEDRDRRTIPRTSRTGSAAAAIRRGHQARRASGRITPTFSQSSPRRIGSNRVRVDRLGVGQFGGVQREQRLLPIRPSSGTADFVCRRTTDRTSSPTPPGDSERPDAADARRVASSRSNSGRPLRHERS